MTILPLEPGCPWYELSLWGLPNVKWCEATRCSIIAEPFNTWSNLAYIVLGLVLLFVHRKGTPEVQTNQKQSRQFGWVMIFVGACSFVYHMSYTFFFQVFDFVAMYVLCFFLIHLNLERSQKVRSNILKVIFRSGIIIFTLLTFLFPAVGLPVQSLVGILVLLILSTELFARRHEESHPTIRILILSLFIFGIAALCSAADVTRLWCDNENYPWLQGHALWHLFTAMGIFSLSFYYRK